MIRKYWLVKSEPEVFSIDDLSKAEDKTTFWSGVRNYQARNYLRDEIKKGDLVLFYHSNTEIPGIAGICKVIKEGYPDYTAFNQDDEYYDPKSRKENPVWFMIDIKLIKKFARAVSLEEIKKNKKLYKMKLVQKGNRLSVMPVEQEEYEEIIRMSAE